MSHVIPKPRLETYHLKSVQTRASAGLLSCAAQLIFVSFLLDPNVDSQNAAVLRMNEVARLPRILWAANILNVKRSGSYCDLHEDCKQGFTCLANRCYEPCFTTTRGCPVDKSGSEGYSRSMSMVSASFPFAGGHRFFSPPFVSSFFSFFSSCFLRTLEFNGDCWSTA